MNFNKFLAALLVTFSVVFTPVASAEGTFTFTLRTASGNVLGKSTVPASQAQNTELAKFFQSIRDAIDNIIASLPTQESGEQEGTQTKTVWISAKVAVEVTGTGFGTGSGGGVSASPAN